MNIIIANKGKEELLKSDFVINKYKCASGVYTINAIINTISSLDVEYLILDQTAVTDLDKSESLERLVAAIDTNKIYIYLNKESMDDYILICTLINIGIYNFESNIKSLNVLIKNPKTLEDVTSYRNVISSRNSKRKKEVAESRPLTEEEISAKINDYMDKNGIKKKEAKKYNNYLFQLFNGFIIYPIITLALALLYYYFTTYIDKIVSPIDGFKEGLNTKIIGNLITPLFLLAIVLGLLIMFSIDKVYDKIIKERKNVYRKIMLLPVLINFAIFSLDFYLFHFIEKITSNYDFMLNEYMINGVGSVVFGSAILLMGDYLIHNLFIKKNTVEFERVLENNYKWWEAIDVAFIILFTIISAAYVVLSTSFENIALTPIISGIFHSVAVCIVAAILSIKTIILNFTYKMRMNKKKKK